MKTKTILLILSVSFISACTFPSITNLLSKNIDDEGENKTFEIQSIDTPPLNPPTPTPIPSQRIENADALLFAGDLDSAVQEYQLVFEQTDDVDLKAYALLGIGRAKYLARDYPNAIDAFLRILGQYENSLATKNTYFFLAQSYEKINQYALASDAYAQYLALNPGIIDSYVLDFQAAAASAAGNHDNAILIYQAALQANPPANAIETNIKIGQEYVALQDYSTAIQYFLSAHDSATNDYQRATTNLLAGQAYLQLGLQDQAYTRFLDSVIKYPKAYDTFTGLSILVNNGYPVDEFLRGLVDYYAGSYQYGIQAFQRYVESGIEHDGTVHYYKGLCHLYRGEILQAIAEYNQLIENYPTNPLWKEAWEEKAFAYWNDPYNQFASAADYRSAVQTRLDFVNRNPGSDYAPWFLYLTARILEYNGQLEEAAQTWLQLMEEYPAYTNSYRGLFLAGVSYYRLQRFEEALTIFQRCLLLAATAEERAQSSVWIGKTYQMLGDEEQAVKSWRQAEAADPTDYYSIRASQLLNNQGPFLTPDTYDLGYDLEYEKEEAERWLRTTFNIAPETDLSGLAELNNDTRILRAQVFWELGLFNEVKKELESLRLEIADNALLTYRLMNHLLSLNFYKPAIHACRTILNLAGMDDLNSLTAPIYFTHIRFGTYFRQQVMAAAKQEQVHPLILFSIIRQESLFEPFIASSAAARGLMQIIPSTATDIVNRIKWPPNFDLNDLYLANVSVTLGANYFRQQLNFFDGDIMAALAAYNGGPLNALNWKEISNGDPDLFLEIIRYEETQTYIKQIAEFLNIYNLVYSRP